MAIVELICEILGGILSLCVILKYIRRAAGWCSAILRALSSIDARLKALHEAFNEQIRKIDDRVSWLEQKDRDRGRRTS